jgi:hypothetical protein
MSVLPAPLPNLGMGLAQTRIRAEVRLSGDAAGGQLRALNAVSAGEPFRYLRSDLNEPCVQIQCNMASRMRETGRANKGPHFATRRGNKLRQLLWLHAASDHSGTASAFVSLMSQGIRFFG